MRILSRHDCVEGEKCPKCLTIFQHFADFEDGILGCLKCGSVFLGKVMRDDFSFRVKDILVNQGKERFEEVVGDGSSWECPCGFEAKSRAGLAAHQRRCELAAQAAV